MSIENLVREKHAFRERLKEFLSIAGAMTTDELEIALGRLADMLSTAQNCAQEDNIRVKGATLKVYFDLRVAGEKTQSNFKRLALRRGLREWQEKRGEHAYQLARDKWKAECAAIKQKTKGLPFIKRFFVNKPYLPAPYEFIGKVKESTGAPEYLVDSIAHFPLIPKGESSQDVSREEVKLIAP